MALITLFTAPPGTLDSFWLDSNGDPSGAQNREFFASNFSAQVRRDEAEIAQNTEYFPGATAAMDNAIRNDVAA